jgi:hypothetical protein
VHAVERSHAQVLKRMLEFLMENIFVVVGGQGATCAPLLVDLFFYSYETEFIQKLLHEKKKSIAVAFNWTFRYINDVLSINNNQFHSYVDSIYMHIPMIWKSDTTGCSTSASYLDILLNCDAN